MNFKKAVEDTPSLKDHYCRGLQALAAADRGRIRCGATSRSITGSVNFDTALRAELPNDPRWDYGIGWHGRQRNETVIWVEVHPANSKHVGEVLQKLIWLKQWLTTEAPALMRLDSEYVWVASGAVAISTDSPQGRKLAAAGIRFVGKSLKLPLGKTN